MTMTRTEAAAKYNAKNYGTLTVRLDKNLVNEFKRITAENEDSQAQIIKQAIEAYLIKNKKEIPNMIIAGKTYKVKENINSWSLTQNVSNGFNINLTVSKKDCPTYEELKDFITKNN